MQILSQLSAVLFLAGISLTQTGCVGTQTAFTAESVSNSEFSFRYPQLEDKPPLEQTDSVRIASVSSNLPAEIFQSDKQRTETSVEPSQKSIQQSSLNSFREATQAPCGACSLAAQEAVESESFSFKEDAHNFLPMLWNDTRAIANWNNAFWLTAAGGTAIALRGEVDASVRGTTARHPKRWGGTSDSLGHLADPQVHISALLAFYGYSLWSQNSAAHDLSNTLLSAYTITTVSTLLIKAAADTSRPTDSVDNGRRGFPSYHTASSFTLAAVADEYYGPKVGVPAYALAGLIGWSRIDQQAHDLSDVVFGAALGIVIGKSVARYHLHGNPNFNLQPYYDAENGTQGIKAGINF